MRYERKRHATAAALFREITDDVILDYKAKVGILNKNTKFVTRELIKDFKLLRREQRKRQAELRKQRKCEQLLYVAPAALIHPTQQ